MSCIAGQLIFGQIADRCFVRRSKLLMVLLGVAATASLGWASTMFDNPFVPWEAVALREDQRWRVWVAISVAGACRTGLVPLLYEVAAVEPLLTTVCALLAPGGVAVFGHRARNGAHEACLAAAASHGLRWTEIAWRPWEGEGAAGQEAGWGCPLEILHLGKMERAED